MSWRRSRTCCNKFRGWSLGECCGYECQAPQTPPRSKPACQVASDCGDGPAEGCVDILAKPHPGKTAFDAMSGGIRSAKASAPR